VCAHDDDFLCPAIFDEMFGGSDVSRWMIKRVIKDNSSPIRDVSDEGNCSTLPIEDL
jgi:hypothetical protein